MTTPAGAPADPMVGRTLDDRYALQAVVAHGGMATVYRATDTRLERTVAVKVMARRYADDPQFVARFTREAKASARLSSPHVVAVHDYGTDASTGVAYLVMELVPGRNLRQLLQQEGPLPPARAVELVDQVLQALAAAHAAGLVHRDVKPENVLVTDDGRTKVADFGLARAMESDSQSATTGPLLGTVAYLAPEQLENGDADARTDVYATGVLLWELLTGTPPYSSHTPASVILKLVSEDVPPPSQVVEGIPSTLDELVVRATSRAPSARPVDGGAFLAELRAVAPDLPAVGPVVRRPGRTDTQVITRPPPGGPPPRRRRRRGAVVAVVVLLLALLALVGGYLAGAGRDTRAPGVLGLSRAAAAARLATAGLAVELGPERFDETVPAGSVLDQSPRPGGRLRKHSPVTLVLSRGPDRRNVPALNGLALADATRAVQAQGLTAGPVARAYSTVRAGSVISSDPPAGTRLRPGSSVSLVVSRGVQLLPVPDETGVAQDQAVRVLTAAGFTASVTTTFSDTVAKGLVVLQSPSGGTAGKGSQVILQVSKGPDVVTVPTVTDLTVDKAVAALQAQGLVARRSTVLPGGPRHVLAQSPRAGSRVRRGSTVTLYVF